MRNYISKCTVYILFKCCSTYEYVHVVQFQFLGPTVHPGVAAIEASIVDLIDVIRAGAMKKQLFVVLVIVLSFQVRLLVHVVFPKSFVLNPFDLKM